MSLSDDEFAEIKAEALNQSQSDGLSNECEIKVDCNIRNSDLRPRNEVVEYDISPEYLAQLLSDRKKLQSFPGLFAHLEKLLDEEISKVRRNLFHLTPNASSRCLPAPLGPSVALSEKLAVPVEEYPDYNFVGRILGPRGRTAKQLEQDMDCKIMIRGRGSTRNGIRSLGPSDASKSKQHKEHMNEDLHVLITVEDAENRAKIKLQMAVDQVKKLLIPAPEGVDSLKKKQLMELAIINGTYRETKSSSSASASSSPMPKIINGSQIFARAPMAIHHPQVSLLSPPPNATSIILTPTRLPMPLSPNPNGGVINGCIRRASLEGQPLIGPSFLNSLDPQGSILVQLDPGSVVQPTFIDFGYPLDSSNTGPLRRSKVSIRDQPYLR